MTNKKYPDDRLPEDENLGTAGTPRSTGREFHTHSSAFEGANNNQPPSFCEVCGCAISSENIRCSDHQTSHSSEVHVDEKWAYSHVALALVPAISKIHALALASAAFKHRDGVPGDGRSFDLIETMDNPSQTINRDWGGELHDAVKLDSTEGRSLIQVATSNADLEEPAKQSSRFGIDFDRFATDRHTEYLFAPDGSPITDADTKNLEISQPEGEERNMWVVPALLYERECDTENKPVRLRQCSNCDEVKKHVFSKVDGHVKHGNAGTWTCLSCHTQFTGLLPDAGNPGEDNDYHGPTEYELDKSHHETVMSRLETKGELE